jgi:cleavage and polyadenylation specificity factor subunit 2
LLFLWAASLTRLPQVIVSGSPAAVADLASACRAVATMTQDVYTPDVGQCITVGEETKNFSVRLGDSIMASLKMSRVRASSFVLALMAVDPDAVTLQVEDYDVAYVSGVIHFDAESDIPVLERTSLTDAIPLSLMVPAKESDAADDVDSSKMDTDIVAVTNSPLHISSLENVLAPLRPSLFIGDLRLTLLKERLLALNVPSEFAGEGVLVCGPAPPESFGFSSTTSAPVDPRKGAKAVAAAVSEEAMAAAGGKVAVKKTGRGKLVLEGSPGETYFVVRRVVYSLHAQAG